MPDAHDASDPPDSPQPEPPPPAGEEKQTSVRVRWLASDRAQTLANVLTIIVALAAIGLSIWEGFENRRHNRLSVLPHLEPMEATIGSYTPIESEYFLLPSHYDSLYAVGYSLKNTGLGPAVLKNILVYRKGKKVFDAAEADRTYYPGEIKSDLNQLPFDVGTLQKPYSINQMVQAGSVHHLITAIIPYAGLNESLLDSLNQGPLGPIPFK